MPAGELIPITPHCTGDVEVFNYDRLPGSIREDIEQETRVIHDLLARTANNVVQIGLRLQFVRDQIGRKQFQAWLRAEFRWSRSVASKHMCVARVFREQNCLTNLQPSALYVLARKKVSESARRQALRLAAQGSFISKERAEAIVAEHSTVAAPRNNELERLKRYVRNATLRLSPPQRRKFARELMRLGGELAERLSSQSPTSSRHSNSVNG